tara:strand:+ start:148 stop:447 length:300 start_codon:yes stop_codon:yes gene_type:complete
MVPDLYADLKTLAKHNKRSMSHMCAELVSFAINSTKYQQQLEQADHKVPAKPDPRTRAPQAQFKSEIVKAAVEGADLHNHKMAKLIKAMELIEAMESLD